MRRIKSPFPRNRRWELSFLVLFAASVLVELLSPGSFPGLLLKTAALLCGLAIAMRWTVALTKKVIWRLRNRLLVTYVFIGGVPLLLVILSTVIGLRLFSGQIAAYLVTLELDRRVSALSRAAAGAAQESEAGRAGSEQLLARYLATHFPGFQMLRRNDTEWRFPQDATIAPPPSGWQDASGLVLKDGAAHLWAHVQRGGTEIVMLVPLNREFLSGLVPGLADVSLGTKIWDENARGRFRRFRDRASPPGAFTPPAAMWLDAVLVSGAPFPIAIYDRPGEIDRAALAIETRFSAVLRTVFSRQVDWGRGITMAYIATVLFFAWAILFFIVEVISLVIGIRLTRSITGAVHNLYEATRRVREGDFSHRIQVRSRDQLGELADSFNRMTENLEQLLRVAKEKERMQSELEIAREVQNQLYPREVPDSKALRLCAVCHPARMVSGDYFDYLSLENSKLALAIGDVAGKGISAALLMATVQASLRAQLRAGREMAAAVSGAPALRALSVSELVSRLNQQLYAYTSPEKYATFYFAMYDECTGALTYTNAGHPPPLLFRNGSITKLEVNGMIVGAFPFARYEETAVQLQPGDLLVCYTDGVTEPENEYGEMFGEDRLIETVQKNADREGPEIISAVMDCVREWTGSPELQDDMTMLLARRV